MLYIRYILKNIEPLRITDNSTSQSGQMDTLTYIPGMTIRGAVISALAKKLEKSDSTEWKQLRRELFSDQVSYLNAYPIKQIKEIQSEEIELVPSPKGFYEDKKQSEETEMKNVLTKDISGLKRASLGRYCYMSKEKIYFSNVALDSDMRISMGNKEQEKNMFRGQYIARNQMFCGYIIVKKSELYDTIDSVLKQDTIVLGNGRSAGMGKCQIIKKEITQEFPYKQYNIQQAKEGSCYLYLLSNTVMCKENGELTGIDIPTLEKQLGVEKLKIEVCTTSVLKNNGYNRIWDARLPEMLMYEMGSVFRLTYQGVLKKERAETILENGIGLRKNEGFGRVLILEGYEELKKKKKIEEEVIEFTSLPEKELTKEEKQVLAIAAKGYYLEKLERAGKKYLIDPKNRKNPILSKKLAGSQMGTIESYAASLQFMPKRAEKVLMSYLEHAVDKDEARRVQSKQQKRNEVKKLVEKLLKSNPEEFLESELKEKESIMGIPKKELFTEEELLIWKLQFLIEMIRYANKEEDDNGENTL